MRALAKALTGDARIGIYTVRRLLSKSDELAQKYWNVFS